MRRAVWRLCLLAAAFAGGATTSSIASGGGDPRDGDDTYRSLALFARVLNYVEFNYVREIPAQDLIYGAVRGMLATLDPHSAFLDPAQYAAMKSEAQGEFGGIGVELVKRPDGVVVVERYEDSPALKAGLLVDDVIVAVNGISIVGRSLAEVVRRIKGPQGTTVRLTVRRPQDRPDEMDSAEPEDQLRLTLVREKIRVISVNTRVLGDGLGYIRIRTFTERTAEDVAQALRTLKELAPIRGLILDVRDNPGGLLDEAVRVADMWLRRGLIVSTEGRSQSFDREMAHPKGTEPGYPISLLVNGGTASASEIVAGALQDHRRARIIGTQTFGKGSVQTVIELEDGSALKLTIARYFTPKHRSIMGVGITPDVVVPQRISDRPVTASAGLDLAVPLPDPQLDAAVADVRRRMNPQ